MTWLSEEPLPIVAAGILTVLMLGGGWMQTGHRALLVAIVAAILLFGGLLVHERFTVTHREQIQQLLSNATRDVKRNDVNAVLQYIHSRATEARDFAKAEFPKHQFKDCRVTRIHRIKVEPSSTPLAIAEFNVVVEGSFESGLINDRLVPRFVILDLEQENGQWRVTRFRHFDPQEGFKVREGEEP